MTAHPRSAEVHAAAVAFISAAWNAWFGHNTKSSAEYSSTAVADPRYVYGPLECGFSSVIGRCHSG